MDKGHSEEEKKASTLKSKRNRKSEQPSPVLPWKIKLLLSIADFLVDHTRRPDGSLNRRLLDVFDYRVPASPCSSSVPSHDIVVDAARKLWFRLYVPQAAAAAAAATAAGNGTGRQLPLLVFFHGGGFSFLSPASYHLNAFCRRLARTVPAVVLSVNYRRAPEHRYPAPYDDGHDVLRFLDKGTSDGATTAGAAPSAAVEALFRTAEFSRCFLAGDSAGANIVHHVARRWTATGSSPVEAGSRLRLAGLVLLQPFFGGEGRVESEIRVKKVHLVNTERTDWMWRVFLPEGADRDHEAANVFGPRAGAAAELGERFPPVVVAVGGFDPLQDWQKKYAEGLKERGKEVRVIEYPHAFHGFYVFPRLTEARMLMDEIKGFINDTRKA